MIFGKSNKPQTRIDSLIGAGTTVEGDIIFSGGLRIDGEVKGNVRAKDNKPAVVVLSENGRVEGEIHVSHVVINGTVEGPVMADDSLELQPGAKVKGDVSYAQLEIHLGAVVEGRLLHNTQAK
ncbi:MAG: hypothetical protein RIR70_1892, partial [Pseudomonadota bacterium]